jgi:hypothetical protein
MTTFTSEDRANASKYVDEAPYHPGYEDAVILKNEYQDILSTEDCMLDNQLKLDLPNTEEQNSLHTYNKNSRGFNGTDGFILSSFYLQVQKRRVQNNPTLLSEKQLEICKKKLPKYWKQIKEEIDLKQG